MNIGVVSIRNVQARNDICRWLNDEPQADTRFTTMFDLYRIPEDFPEYRNTKTATDPYEKVRVLESALGSDLSDSRLLPYIQLHEFELWSLRTLKSWRFNFLTTLRRSVRSSR